MTLRRVAKSSAPCSDRKPPDIFWRSFIIRLGSEAGLDLVLSAKRKILALTRGPT